MWTRARRRDLGGARARAGTSPTRRSWPGWPSTGPSRWSTNAARAGRSRNGGRCATPSTNRCATRVQRQGRGLHPVLRVRRSRRQPAHDARWWDFLPATDDRVRSTIEAIERDLTEDGFVLRYRATDAHAVDGLVGHEGAFLACSFWMADCLHLIGRHDDANALFERLVGLATTSGSCPRSTTPWPSARWGTSPRPSPTCRW